MLPPLLGSSPSWSRKPGDKYRYNTNKKNDNHHGIEYVKTELKYAAKNSTKADGFPAFLKRALENGWGTDTSKANKAQDQQIEHEKAKLIQQQMEIE
jgi:hypothetical protein